jgi:phenylalanine-4-hydroxylase
MLVVAAPYLLEQNYHAYTPEQRQLWSELVRRRRRQLDVHASREYWAGFERVG